MRAGLGGKKLVGVMWVGGRGWCGSGETRFKVGGAIEVEVGDEGMEWRRWSHTATPPHRSPQPHLGNS